MTGLARQIEALLFLSPEPLPLVALCDLTEEPPGPVQRALAELAERHGPEGGLEVAEVAGGFALRTRADLAEVCDRLRERPPEDRITPGGRSRRSPSWPTSSRSAGPRSAACGAWRPTPRSPSLVERGLLEEAGRPPEGGAMRYRTTALFQTRFSLRGPGDVPPLERFELSGPEAERVRRRLVEAGHLAGDAGGGAGDDGG